MAVYLLSNVTTAIAAPVASPANDDTPEPANTIELKLTNQHGMDAHLELHCSDQNMRYYLDVSRAKYVDEKGGPENIPNSQIIDWWKYLEELYSGYGYAYKWTDFIELQTMTGDLECDLSELIDEGTMSSIYWGSDYYIYAVGFDLEGNVISNIAYEKFTTPTPEKSDITFQFKPVSFTVNEDYPSYFDAVVDVIPSNNDEEYFTEYCKTNILDQYDDKPEYTQDDIIIDQFYEYAQYHKGPSTVEMPNLYVDDFYGEMLDYYIIAVGWNDGPTTDIQKYQFNVNTTPTGIGAKHTDKAFVRVGDGRIEIRGSYDAGVVCTASGQLVGNLRPGRTLNVKPGIYVIKYVADGKKHNAKVMVK